MAKRTNKIPTVRQLSPSQSWFDFFRFDFFSPESADKFKQLFAKYKIDIDTERLKYGLMPVLLEVLREPAARKAKSGLEVHFVRDCSKAFLQRLEVILDDPAFVSYAELDRQDLEEKRNQLAASLADLASAKRERAGPVKRLPRLLVTVVLILDNNGLDRSRRIRFLHELFIDFKAPEFSKTYDNTEEGRIRDWDEAAYKMATLDPPILGENVLVKKVRDRMIP